MSVGGEKHSVYQLEAIIGNTDLCLSIPSMNERHLLLSAFEFEGTF